MRKHHNGHNYKFTRKSHSVKGIWGLILALLSILAGIAMIIVSFLSGGDGTVYLASGGMLAMIVALVAFFLAVSSMREENSYRLFPVLALVFGILSLAGWIFLYVIGFYY